MALNWFILSMQIVLTYPIVRIINSTKAIKALKGIEKTSRELLAELEKLK